MHSADGVQSLAEADTREEVAEPWSGILANRADRLGQYEREGTYREQAERIHLDLRPELKEPITTVAKSIVDDAGGLIRDWFGHDWRVRSQNDWLNEAAENVKIGAGPDPDIDKLLAEPLNNVGADPLMGKLVYDTDYPADHVGAVTLETDTTGTGL